MLKQRFFWTKTGDYIGSTTCNDDEKTGIGALADIPKTAIETEKGPASGLDKLVNGEIVAHVPEIPLADQLNESFKKQPAEVRAAFYTAKSAVKLALEEGDEEAAKLIIAGALVPPELEKIRDDMLGLFP